MEGTHPEFTLVLALAVGILAQSVARHLRLPGIVVLLIAGAGLGADGLGWVRPEALGDRGLNALVELSVAIILFEGGLNLEISRLRRAQAPIRRLVLGGSIVTLIGGGIAAHYILGWSWTTAMVFGSLVVVTGPTVVTPLIAELRLRPRVATVLEAEGVLIDPIGAILAVLMLELALAPGADSLASGAMVLLKQLGFGAVMGIAGGYTLAALLGRRRLVPEGLENVVVLATVLLLFQGCQEVYPPSGLLAVTIAGVVVGNSRTHVDRDLREFKDQLTVLLIGMLFVLLAANVRLDDVRALGWPGVAVLGVLVFVLRPFVVWLATSKSEMSFQERALVAWIAPRGIVAAAIGSAVAVALARGSEEFVPIGQELMAMVFLVIAGTVILAGLTAGPVATLLGQRLPGREGVAILGAGGLGLLLGTELRSAGVSVVFFDSNPQSSRRAEEEGFQVVFGNALQERTLQRARLEGVGTMIGLTTNQMLNSVFVSRSRERFSVPQGYVAVQSLEKGLVPELVDREEAGVLFDGPHDVERWDVRSRHGGVEIERWVQGGAAAENEEADEAVKAGDTHVVLAVRRGNRTFPMHAGHEWKEGDVAAVAVHVPERDEAHAALRALGLAPVEAGE